jgi:NADH-quinone oxidoreductase subunit G
MARMKVDDREYDVRDGAPLLQTLLDLGFFIPHFCYHPDLPVDGNCRQCLVEVDTPRGPTGVISCATPVTDGLVVRTQTPAIEKARKAVLEYLLVNHPVDCPVCDQAGECRLQTYYMRYGLHSTRVTVDQVRKEKGKMIGPRVILDQERCVLCRRCVRFTTHVTRTQELTVGGRGDHSFITTFPGKELANRYSVNTVDVCPVGALTDRDFRFACRVWFLKPTDTICPGCARGCNAILETYEHSLMDRLNGTAYRLRPRRNPEVNRSWMCDEGRLLYKPINENRFQRPQLRAAGGWEDAPWDRVLGWVAERIQEAGPSHTAGLCSPDCTNEEIHLFRHLMRDTIGAERVAAASSKKAGDQDDFLLRADRHPNSRGVEFQSPWTPLEGIRDGLESGAIRVLIVLRHDLLGWADRPELWSEALARIDALVVIDSQATPTSAVAHAVLPTGSLAEREGTFVNFRGRIQRIQRAYPPAGEARPEIEILNRLAERLGKPVRGLSQPHAIWSALAERCGPFRGIGYREIGRLGIPARGWESSPAESRWLEPE